MHSVGTGKRGLRKKGETDETCGAGTGGDAT